MILERPWMRRQRAGDVRATAQRCLTGTLRYEAEAEQGLRP
jgi:hypothetical protein